MGVQRLNKNPVNEPAKVKNQPLKGMINEAQKKKLIIMKNNEFK